MSGKVEKLSIALTPEMMAAVRAAVASGEYASTSEVIREWYRDWKSNHQRREAAIAELRGLIEEGMKGPFFDGPTVMNELRATLEAKLKP